MKLLVLGGTEFFGRHFVETALNRNHELTLFNRGKTNPNLFPKVNKIIGDRESDFHHISGSFDAVVDTSGYFPKNMMGITNHLRHFSKCYVFVSSCSVYDHHFKGADSFDEDGQLVDLNIDQDDPSPETYGARKFLCEEVVKHSFLDNHLIARPGLIVGPHDPTYRFPYWADRFSEGGTVLAPGDPSAPLQFIDARDLSEWLLDSVENKLTGTFNTVSPHAQLTLRDFLETAKSVIDQDSKIKWVSERFLKDNNVQCWGQLPLWIYKDIQRFLCVDSSNAISHGLKFRPIEDTIKDTHEWSKPIYRQQFLKKVLSRELEMKLLTDYEGLNEMLGVQ